MANYMKNIGDRFVLGATLIITLFLSFKTLYAISKEIDKRIAVEEAIMGYSWANHPFQVATCGAFIFGSMILMFAAYKGLI